jgi:hypothetical protein
VALIQGHKRLSIRAVALRYGIPSRVVARAVWLGELNAIKTTTETGRERVYILIQDADNWFSSLPVVLETAYVSRSK